VRRATANPNPRTEQRRRAHLMDGGRGRRGGGPPSPAGSGAASWDPPWLRLARSSLLSSHSPVLLRIDRPRARPSPAAADGQERRLLPPARRRRRAGGWAAAASRWGRVKEAAGRVGRSIGDPIKFLRSHCPATFAYPRLQIAINASSACDARRFPICRLLVFLQKSKNKSDQTSTTLLSTPISLQMCVQKKGVSICTLFK
jgi:hypothetical protein